MSREHRVGGAPPTQDLNSNQWQRQVTDGLNNIPAFSVFSTTNGPNASGVTAGRGTIGIDIGSAVTRLWVNRSGLTSGWSAIGLA